MENTDTKKLDVYQIEGDSFKDTMEKRIEFLEKNALFDVDVTEDPETIPLEANKIDYLKEKLTSKIKTFIANQVAIAYFEGLIRKKELVIKEVKGIENYTKACDYGAIVTCNHFHPYDNYAVLKAIEKHMPQKRLYKIIREGNYTNYKGLYGFFFKNCNTLPLSQNFSTMKKFIFATKELLERGYTILIYPEQSLWWNYRKPKPLKNGAFEIAAKNNVPVVPIFITMKDSDKMGKDGYYIQEYTMNILEPIFPDKNKSVKENTEAMKNANYKAFKETYEKVYGIPLKYTCEEQ